MPKQTAAKTVLFLRTFGLAALGLFAAVLILLLVPMLTAKSAAISANDTVNFQARLLNSSGSIVKDGNYNIEFKLYDVASSSGSSQGSCSGDSHCLWTETRTAGNVVNVTDGYLTVDLGSVTGFPNNINWNQNLYLTMNVGGVGSSPTWDGEMNPRIHLTAVPYAFQANQLTNVAAGYNELLKFTGAPSSNVTISLPDASGTVCLDASVNNCSYLTGSTANGSYIQLQSGSPGTAQTGNLHISGAALVGSLAAAGDINTTGYYRQAGQIVVNTTTGTNNSFFGVNAGNTTTTGYNNTASGLYALQSNTTGSQNTASGYVALANNITGSQNTAVGLYALGSNTTGSYNSASGAYALPSNTTGSRNTVSGAYALENNTTGIQNTASGAGALQINITGSQNTASGYGALGSNTTGGENTAVGAGALLTNTTGYANTALGYGANVASASLINATAIGANANVGESNALILGGTGTNAVNVGIGTSTPNNALSVVGNIAASGTITGGVGSPDYAENITASNSSVEAADVVTMDPAHPGQVIKASTAYDPSAMGVISTHPGFVTNADASTVTGGTPAANQVPLALSGRVPVKVSDINGDIEPGDYLTTSTIPGVAMKATAAGPTIGKAMTAFAGASGPTCTANPSYSCGSVTVFIDNTYYNPATAGNLQGGSASFDNLMLSGNLSAASITISGNATIGGDLTVAGDVSFSGNELSLSNNVRGTNVSVPASANSHQVMFGTAYPDGNYAVMCTPNFNSDCYVTQKTAT
ncbi:MAG: beta strand repeat-containing protein, partial [Candidatus Saccharimonadales bacterium]